VSVERARQKLARARVLSAQAERLRSEAEEELLEVEHVDATPVVTELDEARARRRLESR
jgi:hypothetical protein